MSGTDKIVKVGDVIEWGEDKFPMKCLYKTVMNEREYIILHPVEAPDDIQFVPMRLTEKGSLMPETNRGICESIVNLYKQKEYM